MAMTRTAAAVACGLLLVISGCGQDDRPPPKPVDCSVEEAYEFKNIEAFPNVSNWYCYGDPTPGGVPPLQDCAMVAPVDPPERCGDANMLKLEAFGHNFWGAGFGDWAHNEAASRAHGAGYEGISFWLKSAPNRDKTFLLRVDDVWTFVTNREVTAPEVTNPDPEVTEDNLVECLNPTSNEPQVKPGDWDLNGDGCLGSDDIPKCEDPDLPQAKPGDHDVNPKDGCLGPEECHDPLLPQRTAADEDLDGDWCLGPGDIASGTECRLPPAQELGDPACYKPGVGRPGTVSRVPESDECGNYFHTYITATDDWQLVLIPWRELVQWSCPNRRDGITVDDIASFKIEFIQGTHYELWIDNMAFYRRRADAGS
jgi:hypothetical protein